MVYAQGMTTYWAKPEIPRQQMVLFAPCLDDMIGADDSLRVLDGVFTRLDWSLYEKEYDGAHGQPPIHPRYVAAAIFYGVTKGQRSSRKIEDATRMRIDFMWLLEGRTIDHSTISKFRTRFGAALRATFREVNREGLRILGERLNELVVDGTRVRACSDRQGARNADWLEKRLADLQRQMDEGLAEMAREDARNDPSDASVGQLEQHLEELQRQRQRYEEALAVARERDQAKRDDEGRSATAVRVPLNDPDAAVLPNKEGGYAPNYTPVAAVDSATGMILTADVLLDGSEAASVKPLLEQVKEDHGQAPQRLLADSGFASGANQAALEQDGIAFHTPVDTPVPETHPARRDDPSQPLPQDRIAALPRRRSSGKLDGNAFLFDPARNCYWCPMGRALPEHGRGYRKTRSGKVLYVEYMCLDCTRCPLAGECLSRKATRRRVARDEYESARENTARRMATPEGKEAYRHRAPVIEGTFGTIKGNMGVRFFLLRGLQKVRTEWLWICTAFNLRKLLKLLAAATAPATPRPSSPTHRSLDRNPACVRPGTATALTLGPGQPNCLPSALAYLAA
jgi:transposase